MWPFGFKCLSPLPHHLMDSLQSFHRICYAKGSEIIAEVASHLK
ncbi:MAG: hypothetical protein ACI9CP_000963 [Cryomorphaceae bacterium]|jgi:hypothetical protein